MSGPTLYDLFCEGIFRRAVKGHRTFGEWKLIPAQHIGRQASVTLIRKMLRKMEREYPGAFTRKRGTFEITEEFAEFIGTHLDMGSTSEEMVNAWSAMRSM